MVVSDPIKIFVLFWSRNYKIKWTPKEDPTIIN